MFSDARQRESDLLSGLRAGDAAAFRSLVSTYNGSLMRFARAIVGSEDAKDVVQEAWLKAIRALPRFEGRSSLRSWLLSIVRNEAISRLRQKMRDPARDSIDDIANDYGADGKWLNPPSTWSLDSPEALLAAKDTHAVIDKTLQDMPPAQRAVLDLVDTEGLSFAEVCNILEISASNARVLLHRARRRIWTAINADQTG
jgi:RNA polymerase sigma-70 factor, ECF subfamily